MDKRQTDIVGRVDGQIWRARVEETWWMTDGHEIDRHSGREMDRWTW